MAGRAWWGFARGLPSAFGVSGAGGSRSVVNVTGEGWRLSRVVDWSLGHAGVVAHVFERVEFEGVPRLASLCARVFMEPGGASPAGRVPHCQACTAALEAPVAGVGPSLREYGEGKEARA